MPLDKTSTGLTAFPDDIPADTDELLLYANKIKKVPPSIGALKNLTVLNVFNNAIGLSLPEEIGTLTELTEVNLAANKLAMLKDAHFASWSKVTVLNINDNNLGAIGSLAPLVALEELRLYANQLTAMPVLGSALPDLKVLEIHKNRIAEIDDDYFAATPALERLSIWGNQLTTLPSSLATKCPKLVGIQAQTNPLTSLPAGPWPTSLETLFVQEAKLTALPDSLLKCSLKRVNIGGVQCDDELAKKMESLVLGQSGAIFWDKTGKQTRT